MCVVVLFYRGGIVVMGVCLGRLYVGISRGGNVFVRSWAMVQQVALGSAVSDVCTIGGDLFKTLLFFLFFR